MFYKREEFHYIVSERNKFYQGGKRLYSKKNKTSLKDIKKKWGLVYLAPLNFTLKNGPNGKFYAIYI